MPRVFSLVVSIALLGFTSACQSGEGDRDREECDRLVDHLVDVQLGADDGAGAAHAAEHTKHRRILRDAIRDRVVADCMKRPAAHTECALRARTSAELGECN